MAGNVPPRGQAPGAARGGPAVEHSPNDHYSTAGRGTDLCADVRRRVRGGDSESENFSGLRGKSSSHNRIAEIRT